MRQPTQAQGADHEPARRTGLRNSTPLELYIDAQAGIAGDMLLGALLHLGVPRETVLAPLVETFPPFELVVEPVVRHGIACVRVAVVPGEGTGTKSHHHHHERQNLSGIHDLLERTPLPPWVRTKAAECFELLARAEAAAHGIPVADVHFHEVGALDSLVDTVGTLLAVHALSPARVICSSLPLGSGWVETSHGMYPVPAPATLALAAGIPTHALDVGREVSTPTGMALARVLASEFGSAPAGRIIACGYGAGSRTAQLHEPPNLLRVWTFTPAPTSTGAPAHDPAVTQTIVVLETNVDHVSGEDAGHLLEHLLERGALDVFLTATVGKKSRPGLLVTVLSAPETADHLEDALFRETGTLGIRRSHRERHVLVRETVEIEVAGERIRVKRGYWCGRPLVARPEYEDLRRLAEKTGRPLAEIRREAERALAEQAGGRDSSP